MIFLKRIYTLTAVFFLCAFAVRAQDRPIGYWRSHLPYNTSLGVATDGTTLFNICDMAFFTFVPMTSGEMVSYSKTDGMSDLGMQVVGYDVATATTILVYANGNIDLFKDNTFYNLPDLKIKNVAGSKQVFNIYTENGTAYLSTTLGILVVDLVNYNVSETYQFIRNNQIIPVTSFMGAGDYFYATTSYGLYRAEKSNPELQNFQVWTKLDTAKALTGMASVNNKLLLSDIKHVYEINHDTLRTVFTSAKSITHIDAGINRLLISEYDLPTFRGAVRIMDLNYQIVDTFSAFNPRQALDLSDGSTWVADAVMGLTKQLRGSQEYYFRPSGPNNPNAYDIYVHNKNIWVAHGGYTDKYAPLKLGFGGGMSNYYDSDKWRVYQAYDYAPFSDSVTDLVTIVKDEKDGTVYTGSFVSGLFILKKDGTYELLKQNSLFDKSVAIDGYQVIGTALDQAGNLWVSTAFSDHKLYKRTPDGVWSEIRVPNTNNGGPITIDENGQVWFVAIFGGGIAVYNPADSTSYHFSTGVGFGNLPSNLVFCLANDKNNNIWVGTDNGIGIISNCDAPFRGAPPCDAELPIVQYDQFAGYLFAGNNVRTIAVDGANRKWVGTDNGVWLLSPDAGKIIYRFTAENSPLPSNTIEKIAIDKVTGDVYIGTDHGLISYHSTATDGGTENADVLVYPNPVTSGYKGTIAIKGLAANADVRITDIDGQLVYRTKALGGQAVWNGTDYKGHRPATGVYLIFVSSSDGSQTYAGKIVFMN